MDAGLMPGLTYSYQVAAANAYGTPAFSNLSAATTPIVSPLPVHPNPQSIGDFQTTPPPNLVTATAPHAGNIHYQGELITFTLTGTGGSMAATTYEVRDSNGNLVDNGVTTGTLTLNVSTLGWYKLYLFGNQVTTTWGDVVGGTTFAIIRSDTVLPAPADLTNFVGQFVRLVLTRIDPAVAFDWGTGSPDPSVQSDNFGVIWTGQIQPSTTAAYTFYVQADDRAWLYVNG